MTNEELAVRIKNGIEAADNMLQLWQQNKAFIHMIALKYSGYAEIEDLEQEGFIGLCNAVEGYRPEECDRFINYAALWVRQAMLRYIENCGSCVRIPAHMHNKMREYRRLQSDFSSRYGRKPTDWEIKHLLGVSWENLKQIENGLNMKQTDSLSREIVGAEGESLCLGDTIASDEDVENDVLDREQTRELSSVLWPLVDALPGDQAAVIRMRYHEAKTYKAAGAMIGGSPEKARQTEQKALRALRESGRLKPFLPEAMGSLAYRGTGARTFNITWTSSTERAALWL